MQCDLDDMHLVEWRSGEKTLLVWRIGPLGEPRGLHSSTVGVDPKQENAVGLHNILFEAGDESYYTCVCGWRSPGDDWPYAAEHLDAALCGGCGELVSPTAVLGQDYECPTCDSRGGIAGKWWRSWT